MWVQSLFVFVLVISIIEPIKVPMEKSDVDNLEIVPSASTSAETFQARPIYYASSEDNSDSYLIPLDPHKHLEVHHELPTPATYLLPPSPDAQNEYFLKPTDPGEQTDWYPVSDINEEQNIVNGQPHEDKENLRIGKTLNRKPVLSMPTRNLLPPKENAPNDFIVVSPSVELELPLEEIDHTINNPSPDVHTLRKPPPRHFINQENIPVHHISPPKYYEYPRKYKNPTGLYPKKYVGEFKPILIPISQYGDGSKDEIPLARPVKLIKPDDIKQEITSPHIQTIDNSFDKTRKIKKYNEEPKLAPETDDTYREVTPSEQDTSETNFRHPTRDTYPVPAKPQTQTPFMSDGKRTEFRMHGMKGPHSYQFGYDTGKGKNRQFRYEERDNDGHVRGHYGYVDRGGKLRVVNYDADPVHGFRAEAPVEKDI